MSPDSFNSFYRFAFMLCRDPGKRNLQVGHNAVAAVVLPCTGSSLLSNLL
jgi:hypothetical protein